MGKQQRTWEPWEVAYLARNYRRLGAVRCAARLGRSVVSVKGRARRLPTVRHRPPAWTDAERELAARLLVAGWSYGDVAERLGRSVNAVKLAMHKAGHRRLVLGRADGMLSTRAVARYLGYETTRQVLAWIGAGYLQASRVKHARRGGEFAVYPAHLHEFLSGWPERYEYRRIPRLVDGTINPFRQSARQVDPAAGHLTAKQAARRLGRSVETVRRWCRDGKLRSASFAGQGIHPREVFVPVAEVARLETASGQRRAA